ncbi:proton-conducting transporter membrane subunit [Streptomyces sp. NPDC050636]|uniref:proton-conducting transporter transmembrane domain-containing protein n=1 Tax=Streptomyces sp. NPDC050636 TaxID=3154510 RepID=UPI003418F78D
MPSLVDGASSLGGAASVFVLCAPVAVPLAVCAAHAASGLGTLAKRRGTLPPQETDAAHGCARRAFASWAGLVSPVAILGCGAVLAATVVGQGPVTALGGVLRADALTAWMLLVVGAVALLACAASTTYLAHEHATGHATDHTTRRYRLLVHAFLGAMSLAVLAANLGVLWAAIEATTIVTAFLVGHRRTRASVEAAWKYVVVCSAGIALAFLGIVLIYYAARAEGIPEANALDWPTLVAHADRLDPATMRLGTALIVLGFGAKAGLVPLHAWLPDAHSQAPAPVSALMSGVLLSVAFAAILRGKVIADAALGPGFAQTLLAGTALLTLALAAALLLHQGDYKRMLAYSSMEHMGLIALGAAIGTPLALAATLLHIAGHGLAKTVAFCTSGDILHLYRTTRIGRVRGLLARAPAPAATFGLAVVALLGFPPFSLFASELGIARAGFAADFGWPTALALLLVLTSFAALALRTAHMVLGRQLAPAEGARIPVPAGAPGGPPAPQPEPAHPALESSTESSTEPGPVSADDAPPVRLGTGLGLPLALGLLACAALGITTGPLTDLLSTAAAITGRH